MHLISKGISLGILTTTWTAPGNVSEVEGLVAPSRTNTGTAPPSLIIRPFHQASNIVSLRQFIRNAFNHHHGMQAEERFGLAIRDRVLSSQCSGTRGAPDK